MKIGIKKNNITWNSKDSTFNVKGADVKFATSYKIENEDTGNIVEFNFVKSTGGEWDVNTKWIYESMGGVLKLKVGNENVTQKDIDNYVNAKMR